MKKTFFTIITMIFFMGLSVITFAQNLPRTLTNNEIANIIAKSKEANESNGVIDPNLIYPGQPLTFLFEDGTMVEYRVEKGDNQWGVVKRVLADSQKYGDVINYTEPPLVTSVPPTESTSTIQETTNWNRLLALLVLLAAMMVLMMMVLMFDSYQRRKNHYVNPATAGPAFRQGGIQYDSENEHENVSREFQRQYSEPMTNIRRCLISTVGEKQVPVKFADNTTQDLRLRNEPGYEGRAANGQLRYILGACANGFDLQKHMTPLHLSIIYLSEVPVPEGVVTETANQSTGQRSIVESQSVVDAENIESIASIAAEMPNGGKIQMEYGSFKLVVELNNSPNIITSELPMNGAKKEEAGQDS